MTIHKSKGLEFPVVIVPDLQRKFNIRNRLALFLPGLGLGLKVADERGKLIETARFRRLARQDNAMEKAELKRLLYVAMTRAERQIIMSAVVDSPKTEKRFANSTGWLDWTRNLTGLTGPVQEWPEQVMMGETCVRILKENGQFRMTDDFTAKLAELDRIRIGEEISREAAIIPVENKTTPDNLPDDISINISPICAIPTKAKILSPAYLSDFTACPRRYFYAHICRKSTCGSTANEGNPGQRSRCCLSSVSGIDDRSGRLAGIHGAGVAGKICSCFMGQSD
jgi:hypothetical protein